VQNLEASFPNIKYSRDAAKNARLNFEVVRDKYANGIVNITDLLEAQTASLNAQLQAVSAMYNFLIDLTEFQRSLAFFKDAKSEEEIQTFLQTIQESMNQE
jgi:outer membrane protein TolC